MSRFGLYLGVVHHKTLDQTDDNDIPIIERLLPEPRLEEQPELHIHIVIPPEFQTFGKYNIGITGLETTACPPTWIQGMNRMNVNIVPSTFVKDVISKVQFDVQDDKTGQKQGVLKNEKPIEVLFEGKIDTSIFGKTNEFSTELVSEMEKIEEDFFVFFMLDIGYKVT